MTTRTYKCSRCDISQVKLWNPSGSERLLCCACTEYSMCPGSSGTLDHNFLLPGQTRFLTFECGYRDFLEDLVPNIEGMPVTQTQWEKMPLGRLEAQCHQSNDLNEMFAELRSVLQSGEVVSRSELIWFLDHAQQLHPQLYIDQWLPYLKTLNWPQFHVGPKNTQQIIQSVFSRIFPQTVPISVMLNSLSQSFKDWDKETLQTINHLELNFLEFPISSLASLDLRNLKSLKLYGINSRGNDPVLALVNGPVRKQLESLTLDLDGELSEEQLLLFANSNNFPQLKTLTSIHTPISGEGLNILLGSTLPIEELNISTKNLTWLQSDTVPTSYNLPSLRKIKLGKLRNVETLKTLETTFASLEEGTDLVTHWE